MAHREIIKRVARTTRVNDEEAHRLNEIHRQAMEDFSPVESPPGFGPHVERKG
jgi:hypothetical protein